MSELIVVEVPVLTTHNFPGREIQSYVTTSETHVSTKDMRPDANRDGLVAEVIKNVAKGAKEAGADAVVGFTLAVFSRQRTNVVGSYDVIVGIGTAVILKPE